MSRQLNFIAQQSMLRSQMTPSRPQPHAQMLPQVQQRDTQKSVHGEIEEINQCVQNYEHQLRSKSSELMHAKLQVRDLDNKIKQTSALNQVLEAKVKEEEHSRIEVNQRIKQIKLLYDQLISRASVAESKFAQVEADCSGAVSANAEFSRKIEELVVRFGQIEKAVVAKEAQYRVDVAQLKADHDSIMKQLQCSNAELSASVDKSEEKVIELELLIESLQSQIADREKNMERLSSVKISLEDELNALHIQKRDLEIRFEDLSNRHGELENRFHESLRRIEEINNDSEEKQLKIDHFKSELQNYQNQIDGLSSLLESTRQELNGRIQELRSAEEDLNVKLEQANQTKITLEAEKTSLQQGLEDLRTEHVDSMNGFMSQLDSLNSQLAEAKQANDALTAENRSILLEKNAKAAALQMMTTNHDAKVAELSQVSALTYLFASKIDQLEIDLAQVVVEKADLHNRIEARDVELEKVREEIDLKNVKICQLEQNIQQEKAQFNEIKILSENLSTEIQGKDADLAKLSYEIEKVTLDLAAKTNLVAELQDKVGAAEKLLADEKEKSVKVEQLMNENSVKLQSELEKLREEITKKDSDHSAILNAVDGGHTRTLNNLKSQKKDLDLKLKKVQEELQKLQGEFDSEKAKAAEELSNQVSRVEELEEELAKKNAELEQVLDLQQGQKLAAEASEKELKELRGIRKRLEAGNSELQRLLDSSKAEKNWKDGPQSVTVQKRVTELNALGQDHSDANLITHRMPVTKKMETPAKSERKKNVEVTPRAEKPTQPPATIFSSKKRTEPRVDEELTENNRPRRNVTPKQQNPNVYDSTDEEEGSNVVESDSQSDSTYQPSIAKKVRRSAPAALPTNRAVKTTPNQNGPRKSTGSVKQTPVKPDAVPKPQVRIVETRKTPEKIKAGKKDPPSAPSQPRKPLSTGPSRIYLNPPKLPDPPKIDASSLFDFLGD